MTRQRSFVPSLPVCMTWLFLLFAQVNSSFEQIKPQHVLATDTLAAENDMPTFTVDWGTYTASKKDTTGDFYVFKNIQFGAAPVKDLRFQKSRFPQSVSDPELTSIETNTNDISCYSIDLITLKKTCPKHKNLDHPPFGNPSPNSQSEDCLYLDIYVPASALSSKSPSTPVVVWFYGGAYVSGAKSIQGAGDMMYSGTGLMRVAQNKKEPMIFVVGNYRLGAFGWLAGEYMEKNGYPNAGLSDQRLMLEFVNKFISRVGGDPTKVSAWGESAGGGSILHHLTAENGTRDPLFSQALVQSPAYSWAWDRKGTLSKTYSKFAKSVGCDTGDMECLQNVPSTTLADQNYAYVKEQFCAHGIIPFGPAVDGKTITSLTPIAFENGAYWKGINSIIASHVVHESNSFIPDIKNNEKAFTDFLKNQFPGCPAVVDQISNSHLYAKSKEIQTQKDRLILIARDAFFTSNVRDLFNAYGNTSNTKFYAMQYQYPYALYSYHAYDLLPTFWYPGVDLLKVLRKLTGKAVPGALADLISGSMHYFSPNYQSRFVAHATTGDPNTKLPSDYTPWPVASSKCVPIPASIAETITDNNCPSGQTSAVTDVLFTQLFLIKEKFFSVGTDEITTDDRRAFWTNIAKTVTANCSAT